MSEAKDNLKPITAFACAPDESDQPGVIRTVEATPRPWHYQEGADVYTHIIRGPGLMIQLSQDHTGKSEANARLIVRCVNTHAALVEALESARDLILSAYSHVSHGGPTRAEAEIAIAKANGALKLARKE